MFATMWIGLEGMMLGEISQKMKTNIAQSHLCEESDNNQTHRNRDQIGSCQSQGEGGYLSRRHKITKMRAFCTNRTCTEEGRTSEEKTDLIRTVSKETGEHRSKYKH